jgi:hypothetical protein
MIMEMEPEGVWGNLEKPFEGFKIASKKVPYKPHIEETKEPEPVTP